MRCLVDVVGRARTVWSRLLLAAWLACCRAIGEAVSAPRKPLRRTVTALLPCPFCGRLPWLVLTGGGLTHVHCASDDSACEVGPRTAFYARHDAAVAAWNHRTLPASSGAKKASGR